MMKVIQILSVYKTGMLPSIIQQALLLALIVLLKTTEEEFYLDALQRSYWFALLAFWVGCAMVIRRRPTSPSRDDLLVIRYGFIPLVCFTFAVSICVLLGKGFSPKLF